MALTLDPSRDVTQIQTQMNRLFDNFFGQPSPSGMMERAWTPPVDGAGGAGGGRDRPGPPVRPGGVPDTQTGENTTWRR